MKWVTWERVGVDRMACAWLIRRFVDSKAKFVFIARNGALPRDAEPFDIPGVRLSHHEGHCSFHAMLQHFKLGDPVLARIARIIDEADTVQEVNVEPAAAGVHSARTCFGARFPIGRARVAARRGGTQRHQAFG